jgi:uncharacterized membrane protein (DUF4010 family)
MGANFALCVRTVVATSVLEPALAAAMWPVLVAPAAVSLVLFWIGWRSGASDAPRAHDDQNPLQIRSALYLAAFFQFVLFLVAFAHQHFGQQGLMGSAALVGLTDVDSLILSLSRMTSAGTTVAAAAARALTLGILVNTVVKLGLAVVLGRGSYRPLAAAGLALTAFALAGALYVR